MEGDEKTPLLAGSPTSSPPSRDGASASDEGTRQDSPRGSPTTKEHPSPYCATPPPPAAAAANRAAISPSTSTPPAASDKDDRSTDASPSPIPPAVASPNGNGNGNANKQDPGVAKNSPTRPTPTIPSLSIPARGGVPVGNGTSPSAGFWCDLLRRRRGTPPPPPLPVSALQGTQLPAPAPRVSFREQIRALRRQGPRLDSVGVEKVIGLFGFSLFGSLSLLPSTVDRLKDKDNFTDNTLRIIILLCFFSIWVLASVGLLCGLHGKSDFEQRVCRITARLGILGLTVLVTLHLVWMLPSGTLATTFFFVLTFIAIILHIVSWIVINDSSLLLSNHLCSLTYTWTLTRFHWNCRVLKLVRIRSRRSQHQIRSR